jgi:hypothetical protein
MEEEKVISDITKSFNRLNLNAQRAQLIEIIEAYNQNVQSALDNQRERLNYTKEQVELAEIEIKELESKVISMSDIKI